MVQVVSSEYQLLEFMVIPVHRLRPFSDPKLLFGSVEQVHVHVSAFLKETFESATSNRLSMSKNTCCW